MSLRIVGGLFRGRILKSPKGTKTRPTTSMAREAIFNICRDWVPDSRFLDLFAGSGAMGFEAISRGASFVTFIEKDKQAALCIRENASLLQVEPQVQILASDATLALSRLLGPYDLIYIDPPYEHTTAPILTLIASQKLLAPRGLLFLEERFQTKQATPTPENFSLVDSRRYGIAHIHQFRWDTLKS
jgi:16S rRNA (guanine966-N2)-methyltransferase